MNMRITVAAMLTIALLNAGCSDPTAPAAPTPVPAKITDTFTGTLAVSATNVHPFAVQQVGNVQVTLTSISPGASVLLGVGTPSSSTGMCSVLNSITVVPGTTPQLNGTATIVGNLCVSISDVGDLVEPVSYTIVVFHS
jgi:hypothetical protein